MGDVARGSSRVHPCHDSLIAATALVHDLIVATQNRTDFEKSGVKIVDPFTGAIWCRIALLGCRRNQRPEASL